MAVGERAISAFGHVRMMAAAQPFISGAISKTVNMPEAVTVDDIAEIYTEGWKLGLKALAIYRDGSKTAQALKTDAGEKKAEEAAAALEPPKPVRRRMPRERQSLTHKFSIAGHEGYITAGEYEDGTLGEVFLTDVGKEGSTIKGLMNAFATAVSIGLQYGVPLDTLVRKFAYMRFEPEGYTGNPEIPFAKSMPDYIMRWLASRYGDADLHEELGILTPEMRARKASQEAIMRGDTAGPAETSEGSETDSEPANGKGNGGNGGGTSASGGAAEREAGCLGPDRRAPGDPGQAPGPRARPGVRDVRRHDAAHGLVLHVLELREQHGLRLRRRDSVDCRYDVTDNSSEAAARVASAEATARARTLSLVTTAKGQSRR